MNEREKQDRYDSERNLDISSLAEKLFVTQFTHHVEYTIEELYDMAKEFVDYGLKHYPYQ